MPLRTKLTALLLVLVLALPLGVSVCAEPAPASAVMFAQLSRLPVAAAPAKVSVLLCDAEGSGGQPDIRYDARSAEDGLYTCTDAAAGALPAQPVSTEDGGIYTVDLTEPGRYLLNGEPFYVIAAGDESMTALQNELAEAAVKAEGKTQAQTAQKLYDWLVKRIRNVPAEEADEKMKRYGADPVNCLLMGAALPETYADLYHLVLRYANIESIIITGSVGETAHRWVLCRLDGEWLHADPALDDVKDKAGKKYFALDEGKITKDHALSEASATFVRNMVDPLLLDAFMGENRVLRSRLELKSEKEGQWFDEYEIQGRNWSLGPSGPVTIRRIKNWKDYYSIENESDWIAAVNIIPYCCKWNERIQTYYNPYEYSPEVKEEQMTVLSVSEDHHSVTVTFNEPGCYLLNGSMWGFYVLDPEDPRQVEVARKLDEILETCKGETDRETAENLYNWVAAQLTYDNAVYKKILKMEDDDLTQYAQDPIACLIRGSGVCGGYSALYSMLLMSAGIPSRQIRGKRHKTENMYHAWDMAKIDGEWVYFDPTWDDKGKAAAKRYFAVSYEKISKDHFPVSSENFLKATVLTGIYDGLLSSFYRDWKPKESLPDFLRVLPADVKAYGFPNQLPNFYNQKLELSDTGFTVNPGRKIMYSLCLVMNSGGARNYNITFGTEVWTQFPYHFYLPSVKLQFFRYTLADYNMEHPFPTDKPFMDQSVVVNKGVVEYEEYNYHVPLKKNEIRGYNKQSYRTWTWDADKKPLAAAWTLVNDTETLTVKVFFDREGKTSGWQIARKPLAGDEIAWGMDKNGHLTLLRLEKDRIFTTLADRTDVWLQGRFASLRKRVERSRPELAENPSLTENGVYIYGLSMDDDSLYSPATVIATRDDLIRVTPEGKLEFNPDVTDLAGKALKLDSLQPVLDDMELISIAAE